MQLVIIFITTISLTEFKCDVPDPSLPLFHPPPPFLPLCHPPPLFPMFSAHPNRSRQTVAHTESGSARGFSQLMREFFLSTVAKVLLIVGTVGFLNLRSRPYYVMIWLLNWTEQNIFYNNRFLILRGLFF